MKSFCFAIFVAFLASSVLLAEPDKKDPIDVTMEEAIDKDPSTAGMVQAAANADEKWQKEITLALAKLKKEMTPEQWKALQVSQRAWSAYHDKELETQTAIYSVMEGTMWRPASAHSAMEINRARALLLRQYIQILSER